MQRARKLRQELTPAERILWFHLRQRRMQGMHFRRQQALGPYIVDFYCAEARLVIELDGDTHDGQMTYDARRTAWLARTHGVRVLRIVNEEVLTNIDGVVALIAQALSERRG
jgi:very-short-patch-repair endonuclease